MKDQQLRSFITAVEYGSFSKAAEASYITTSSFAQQIKLLEQYLGYRLFERSTAGVRLTEAGATFYPLALQILELLDKAKAIGRELEARNGDLIRVCYNEAGIASFVVSLYRAFGHDFSTDIEFVTLPYAEWLKTIAEGDADVCISFHSPEVEDLRLQYHPLYSDQYYCCVSVDHPLAAQDSISLEDLRGQTLFMSSDYRSSTVVQTLLRTLDERGISVELKEADFTRLVASDALFGAFIVLVPGRYLEFVTLLKALPLQGWTGSHGLICRAEHSAAIDALIQMARETLSVESNQIGREMSNVRAE